MGGRLDTPHLYEAQVLVVAAAGNSATDDCGEKYDNVTTPDKLLVGATTEGDRASHFSNYGACVHVQVPSIAQRPQPPAPVTAPTRACACPPASDCPPARPAARSPRRACVQAPGSGILGAWVGSSNTATLTMSGTSMAAPHVSGVAAQLLAEDPTLSVARVKEMILAAAEVDYINLSADAEAAGTPNRFLIGGAGIKPVCWGFSSGQYLPGCVSGDNCMNHGSITAAKAACIAAGDACGGVLTGGGGHWEIRRGTVPTGSTHETSYPKIDCVPALPTPGSCGEYEAEDATASGPQFESSHAGFSGTGFMDFVANDGEYLEWTVAASSTTFIHMNWQYALKYGSRNLQLSVNGETLQEVAFPGSGSWSTWTRTSSVSARLTEGSNTIRIASNGNSGANIDQMRVCVSAYLPVGAYECHKYDGTTTKNNWHYVTVRAEGGRVRWSNRAGVSWMLTPRADGDLDVGEECPYYRSGYTVCKVVRNAAGSVTSLLGPSGEVYARG